MDFTLALTHFCEVHGPKSVLCTQVLPLNCALCSPPSPALRPRASTETFVTQVHDSEDDRDNSFIPCLERSATTGTNFTLATGFSAASTTVNSEPESPSIERHPLFKPTAAYKDISPQFRYGRGQGDTCASCGFTVPNDVASKLPAGAPGSFKADGKSKNGAPVLRSREFVCMGRNDMSQRKAESVSNSSSQHSTSSSFQSTGSMQSHTDCHDHTLTYLTAKSPDDQESFAQLRASVIRTLSCEILPRGMSDGPLCFGDSNTGYTIAYVFRLTDSKARGRRRAYAFIALAGNDATRAFKACPIIWEAFSIMAKTIEQAAQQHQDAQQRSEEDASRVGQQKYTPVSSFLTRRPVDPEGHPRRAGQPTPQSLAEIVGNENIFAILHQYFVHVLRCLGDKFGGLPLADGTSLFQSISGDEDASHIKGHTTLIVEDESAVLTPTQETTRDEIAESKIRLGTKVKRTSYCGPLATDTTVPRRVAV